MKKTLIILGAILALLACNKQEQDTTKSLELKFDVQVSRSGDTKAVKQDFFEGDIIYVFFEDVNATNYITLTKQNSGNWATAVSGTLEVSDFSAGKYMYAVHFPFGNVNIVSDGGTGVIFRDAISNLPIYTYYLTGKVAYGLSKSGDVVTLSGTISMNVPDNYVQFFIDKNEDNYYEDNRYRLAIKGVNPVACASYDAGIFSEQSFGSFGQPMWGYRYNVSGEDAKSNGQGILFSGKIDGTWATVTNHELYFFDTSAPAKKTVLSDKTLASHASIKISAATISSWVNAETMADPVDLGLTSGLKWASLNLGASTETGYPKYYAWGHVIDNKLDEVNGKFEDIYHSRDYIYFKGFDEDGKDDKAIMSKYWTDDWKTVLDPIDDAAASILGNGWRMPTAEEFDELVAGCNWTYYSGEPGYQYKESSRQGYLATSKVNGKSIFFPMVGNSNNNGTSINGDAAFKGLSSGRGYYWSSTLNTAANKLQGHNLCLKPSGTIEQPDVKYRIFCIPIRPVHE